jgi:2-(1,2-epoxy-1,2-dihydrophenyl)acetyl-CoA isomerase
MTAETSDERVIVVDRSGGLATMTLNRPQALNTLDLAMIRALVAETTALAREPELRCVLVRGAGRHFMAGGDLRTFAAGLEMSPAERERSFTVMIDGLHAAIEHLQRMPAVVVASVRGAVAGFGLSLVGACDLAIAADDAYFASAYRNIALTPDGGGTYTLPRIVGLKKAMEIMLLGERFDATTALQLGIVNRVVAAAELEAETAKLAQAILAGPPLALGNTKRLLRTSLSRTLSEALHAEALSFGQCAAHADFAEGLHAFFDKRPPRFSD